MKGVYPVRVAFPASLSPRALRLEAASAARPGVRLAGIAGRGVLIALLDTGVDAATPYLHGHVLPGLDIAGTEPSAQAQAKPTDPSALEEHGTEMAGLLVGAGGPAGVTGVAPAATVLPLRVAGWQPDARGGYTVYSRTDQLLAGLERAVDPDGNGDAHDAARIALVPLVEPFAAFTDGPLARAVDGALRLDTLVVAAAGNDGPAGPAFGSVGGPAGAPSALAVGAADAGRNLTQVRVVVRAGLRVLFDRLVPLVGGTPPSRALVLSPSAPARAAFFRRGLSQVADRAAVAAAGADPATTARAAADAGAAAVILHGRPVAPGAIALDRRIGIPVVVLPQEVTRALRTEPGATVVIAAPRSSGAALTTAAPFSSWGLAFDGGIKPDLLAPGVGLATADPGAAPDGGSVFGTVSGSSAAAAVVAGAAALLAEARPDASAARIRALLVGGARPLDRAPAAAQGAGMLDVGRSAALELVADPSLLTFGRGTVEGWRGDEVLRLRNVSGRRLTVYVAAGRQTRRCTPPVDQAPPHRDRAGRGRPDRRPHSADHDRPRRGGARVADGHPADGCGDPRPVGGRPPPRPSPPRSVDALARLVQAVGAAAVGRRHAGRAACCAPPTATPWSPCSGWTSSSGPTTASASGCSPVCATCCPAGTRSASPATLPEGRCSRPAPTGSVCSRGRPAAAGRPCDRCRSG